MKKTGKRLFAMLLTLVLIAGLVPVNTFADWEDGGECPYCGAYRYDSWACSGCGGCSSDCGTPECYYDNHCASCGACSESTDLFDCAEPPYSGAFLCETCARDIGLMCANCHELKSGDNICEDCGLCHECAIDDGAHCEECNACIMVVGSADCEYCDLNAMTVPWKCMDCHEQHIMFECSECGRPWHDWDSDADYCAECLWCTSCAIEHKVHCPECGVCPFETEEFCEDCQLCGECAAEQGLHCSICLICYNEADPCEDGGSHCTDCCEANLWLCPQCGVCMEGSGIGECEDCGLCEDCCLQNSEDAGCVHGYCVESTDYQEHICPQCNECPFDELCFDCGLCADCCEENIWNTGCVHDMCVESIDFADHLCPQCDECPEDTTCEYCELCANCCESNTWDMGCTHGICLFDPAFENHWCWEHNQCLSKCTHSACTHSNVESVRTTNSTTHFYLCRDCGAHIDVEAHDKNYVDLIRQATPASDGLVELRCSVCDRYMETLTPKYTTEPHVHLLDSMMGYCAICGQEYTGKPYILSQPQNVTAKSHDSDFTDEAWPRRTFSVHAAGDHLTYQWYNYYNNQPLSDNGWYFGTKTPRLTTLIAEDCCDEPYYAYYCVITNAKGTVWTDTVYIVGSHSPKWMPDDGTGTFTYIDTDGTVVSKKLSQTHSRVCEHCDDFVGNEQQPHSFGPWQVEREATRELVGYYYRACTLCGYREYREIPRLNPAHQHQPCGSYNHNAESHWPECSCGHQITVYKDPHAFGPWSIIRPATETRIGRQQRTCSVCGYVQVVTIDKLPHTHTYYSWDVITSPEYGGKWQDSSHKVWINEGKGEITDTLHIAYCSESNCTNSYDSDGNPLRLAERHSYSDWEIWSPSSATKAGAARRSCSECGWEQSIAIPANKLFVSLGHGEVVQDGDFDPCFRPGQTVTIRAQELEGVHFDHWSIQADEAYQDMGNGDPSHNIQLADPNSATTTMTFSAPTPASWSYAVHVDAVCVVDAVAVTNVQVPLAGQIADPFCTLPSSVRRMGSQGMWSSYTGWEVWVEKGGGNGQFEQFSGVFEAGKTYRFTVGTTPVDGLSFASNPVGTIRTADGNVYTAEVQYIPPIGFCAFHLTFPPLEPAAHKITLTNDGNGTANSNPVTAAAGTEVRLTAKPKPGYRFKEWKVLFGTVTIQNNSFIMPDGNVAIRAVFEEGIDNPFVDVKETEFFYDAVLWAISQDPIITNGTDATHFSPYVNCKRRDIVTFLWRANGCPEPSSTENPFTDVPNGAYYTKAVLWAVEKGITTGTGNGRFSPTATCKRRDVVTFLWRAAGSPAPTSQENPFTDVPSGKYYTDAILWAVEKGITSGTSATTFRPVKICTRGQIVTFLYRAYQGK